MLAFHDRSTRCGIVAPEPVAASDAEVELLAMKEMFAEAVPAAVGANVTVKGTLWPAARVTGKVSPATAKAELLELTEESVMPPPLAVTLPFLVWVVPMVTLPKLMEPGVIPNVPLVVVAVPLSETVTDGLAAFDARARLAISVPELVGENVTDRVALEPADREYGRVSPLTVKPPPVMVAAEIVRLVPPVFERVSTLLWLLPTAMLPKLRLLGAFR